MSKQSEYRVAFGALIVVSLALIAVVALWQFQESPQEAYERGFEDGRGQKDYGFALGYVQGGYNIVFAMDKAYYEAGLWSSNHYRLAWQYDMVALFGMKPYWSRLQPIVDSLTALPLFPDSTDTLPVVEE